MEVIDSRVFVEGGPASGDSQSFYGGVGTSSDSLLTVLLTIMFSSDAVGGSTAWKSFILAYLLLLRLCDVNGVELSITDAEYVNAHIKGCTTRKRTNGVLRALFKDVVSVLGDMLGTEQGLPLETLWFCIKWVSGYSQDTRVRLKESVYRTFLRRVHSGIRDVMVCRPEVNHQPSDLLRFFNVEVSDLVYRFCHEQLDSLPELFSYEIYLVYSGGRRVTPYSANQRGSGKQFGYCYRDLHSSVFYTDLGLLPRKRKLVESGVPTDLPARLQLVHQFRSEVFTSSIGGGEMFNRDFENPDVVDVYHYDPSVEGGVLFSQLGDDAMIGLPIVATIGLSFLGTLASSAAIDALASVSAPAIVVPTDEVRKTWVLADTILSISPSLYRPLRMVTKDGYVYVLFAVFKGEFFSMAKEPAYARFVHAGKGLCGVAVVDHSTKTWKPWSRVDHEVVDVSFQMLETSVTYVCCEFIEKERINKLEDIALESFSSVVGRSKL